MGQPFSNERRLLGNDLVRGTIDDLDRPAVLGGELLDCRDRGSPVEGPVEDAHRLRDLESEAANEPAKDHCVENPAMAGLVVREGRAEDCGRYQRPAPLSQGRPRSA